MTNRDDFIRERITEIIREHWAAQTHGTIYASAVHCMSQGCDWTGRFAGDVAEHNADLIMDVLKGYGDARQA